jgi:phosphotransferase system HPr (HPr) family protein
MSELTIRIQHAAGLHARPLAEFVKTAKRFQSVIRVENLTLRKGPADGKSPLSLMLLSVLDGQEVRIVAQGPDQDDAIRALQDLIASDFQQAMTGSSTLSR